MRGIHEHFATYGFTEHFRSSIGFVTPVARHERRDEPILVLAQRRAVYAAARAERWTTHVRPWRAPVKVRLNPDQILLTHYANVASRDVLLQP